MGACSYPYRGVGDVFVAEARACERAVLFASEMGFHRVVIEGDSLEPCAALNEYQFLLTKKYNDFLLLLIINALQNFTIKHSHIYLF